MSKPPAANTGGLTIGKRIALGFGAVLALMVGVTAYGIRDVTQIDRALTEITEVNAVKQRHGINFRGSVHDRAISLRDVVLLNERAGLDRAFADIKRLEEFYAESAQALDAMLAERTDTDAEERAILHDIKDIESATMPLVRQVSEARLRGDRDRAHEIMMSQASPAFSEWLARINRYIDLQEARNQKATAVARATASEFSWIMLSLCALAIALGSAIAWRITRSLLRSLGGEPGEAARIVARIAGGDLSSPVHARNPDSMLGALATMQDKLKDIFGQIVQASAELAEKAEKVGIASREAVKAASLQAEASAASATTIATMTENMRAVADVGHQTEVNSERTSELSREGSGIVQNTAAEIGRIAEIVRASSERIGDLQQRSEEIGSSAQAIREIADQTNLLALNAAIEAARAGESGRGFAVVADEVRKLAERTSSATSEIARVIQVIQADTQSAVSAMEQAGPQVERGLELAKQASTTLADINRQAHSSLDNVRQVARTAEEQVSTAAGVATNVERIAAMSAETNEAMQDNTRAAEDLQAISAVLRDHVARFRLA